ncbi:MAG: hypothetical protein HC853_11545 [Anaerolineae bacterium]|nr:hypothetical protein [Anaerolineae bacterium]
MLPAAAPIWDATAPLAFLQFPWRFLGPAAFALARATHPSEKTYLEIQGHGTALAPDTNYAALFAQPPPPFRSFSPDTFEASATAIPLPRWVDMKDGFTDVRARSVFNVPALARALRAGTQDAGLFDVVNLSHCFAATLEELYEVAPNTAALVASPNYDYLLTEAPAQIFATLEISATPGQMAQTTVQRLYEALPGWMHPGIFVAVDATRMRQIKPKWDEVATAVMAAFDVNAPKTRTQLLAAYRNSAKYDTSQCEPDWQLIAPDALVDAHTFAQQLVIQFGADSAVGRIASGAPSASAMSSWRSSTAIRRPGLLAHPPTPCRSHGCSPARALGCLRILKAVPTHSARQVYRSIGRRIGTPTPPAPKTPTRMHLCCAPAKLIRGPMCCIVIGKTRRLALWHVFRAWHLSCGKSGCHWYCAHLFATRHFWISLRFRSRGFSKSLCDVFCFV